MEYRIKLLLIVHILLMSKCNTVNEYILFICCSFTRLYIGRDCQNTQRKKSNLVCAYIFVVDDSCSLCDYILDVD